MSSILVIEDTDDIREGIVELLEAEEFKVMGAANGKEGIKLAQVQKFDLIICDVMMPEIDGYGVITALRQNPETAAIPFIFLTAKGTRSDLRQGMNLGADDYLTKPCTNEELLEAISARLQKAALQEAKLKQIEEQLEQLENFDSLTGLPNLSALSGDRGYLQQAIAKRSRQQRLIPFLLLGLDRMGQMNDAIGYENGNLILKQLSERLKQFNQRIAGVGVVRLNGDEFALLLSPVSEENVALEMGQSLLKVIAQPLEIDRKSVVITATVGLAFYPDAASLEELRRQAGVAMAQGKQAGGNRCQIYRPPVMGNDVPLDVQLTADLLRIWERKDLQLFYQPRIDLRKNKIVGVETVLYWYHPQLGAVPTTKIWSIVEQSGFSEAVNEWMLKNACEQAKVWQKSRLPLRVGVKLTEQFLNQSNFQETIAKVLQEVALEPKYLELEIAADTIVHAKNANAMAMKLMDCKRLGVQTAIGQFGIQHSSLDYLGQLSLDVLKMERSLVASNSPNAVFINAICQLARNLKLTIVVEGVETEAQVSFLKKYKCDEIQQDSAFSAQDLQRLIERR